ncbi:MAG TPA: C39 family peptidase [Methylophilaceae bacterium]
MQPRLRILSCVFTFALAAVMPSAHADAVRFGSVLPGGAMFRKELVSMRDMKFVDMVPQRTDFSCGAAALATILNYAYGKSLTEEEVIDGLMRMSDPELVRQKGFSLLDIKNYTQSIGMRGRGYNVNPETLEKIRIPTIVLLNYKGYRHFVVLKMATGEKAYIADPALGNLTMKRRDFDAAWNGIVFAVIGQGFDRESVLLKPREALTARTLVDGYRPLTDAELLDFGFLHSDLLGF